MPKNITSPNQSKIDILTLNRLKIINEKNEQVLISSLWKESPAVIIFIRHFGCISCRAHVEQVWSKKEQIKKNGTKIAFIGSGASYLISQFKSEFGITDAPIYTDPTLKTFDACGLLHIDTETLDSSSLEKISEFEKKGYALTQMNNDGSDSQLGGVLAMKPPGIVTYHFVSEFIGNFDNPTDWK